MKKIQIIDVNKTKAWKFYVIAERKCPECDGKGKVPNPKRAKWEAMELETLWNMAGQTKRYEIPPVTVACSRCDGAGFITYRCTIDQIIKPEALQDVKGFEAEEP